VGLLRPRRCFLFFLFAGHPTTLRRTAAASVPSISPPSETIPIIAIAVFAFAPAGPSPHVGTSPAPRAVVPFKLYEESSLWLHSRPPLDDRDDIVEPDFSRTQPRSATSIHLNAGGRTARTFQEGPGEGAGEQTVAAPACVVGCVDAGLSPAVLGRSSQAQAYTTQCVTRSGLAVSPSPRSGVV
jgi:hypothetical protein